MNNEEIGCSQKYTRTLFASATNPLAKFRQVKSLNDDELNVITVLVVPIMFVMEVE